jgi:hypothetical protein
VYDALVQVKTPRSFADALDKAADIHTMSRSDFIRVRLADPLRADGVVEVELPKWQGPALATVEDYDAANAETAVLATEFETRAQKISGYVNSWERSTMDEQNRSLILALADRLDRMEPK